MKRLSIMDQIASLFSVPKPESEMKVALGIFAGLLAGFFFPCSSAFATTFGPISVVDQLQNAQYVVRGSIMGSAWVEPEPRLQRPYTYWRLTVREQNLGNSLPVSIVIRQPGGEIGEIGYHVAGSAEFSAGEDVFVLLRDTDQAGDVKEVIGLASGKYRVERAESGKPIVKSGLGLPVLGGDGQALSPEEFRALVRRVALKESSAGDQSIFINRSPVHEQKPSRDVEANSSEEQGRKAIASLLRRGPAESKERSSGESASLSPKTSDSPANPIQKSPSQTEESHTGTGSGTGWIFAALILAAIIAALVFVIRR